MYDGFTKTHNQLAELGEQSCHSAMKRLKELWHKATEQLKTWRVNFQRELQAFLEVSPKRGEFEKGFIVFPFKVLYFPIDLVVLPAREAAKNLMTPGSQRTELEQAIWFVLKLACFPIVSLGAMVVAGAVGLAILLVALPAAVIFVTVFVSGPRLIAAPFLVWSLWREDIKRCQSAKEVILFVLGWSD